MEEVFLTDLDKRVAMFIEQKGGDSAVAKKTGKKPQLFQGVRTGKRNAGMMVFQELLKAYDDFDETYMLRGIKTMGKTYPKLIDTENEIERLKNELALNQKMLAEKEMSILLQKELLDRKEQVIENLSVALGKDEGEIDAYLVDTEIGFQMMNLITIIQHGGFALDERKN